MFSSLLPVLEKKGKYGHLTGCWLEASSGQDLFCSVMACVARNLAESEKDVCQDTHRSY